MPVRHEQSSGAVRRWHGQSSPMARLPAVTSSPSDLLDLAHLSHHLAGPIVDASDDGGGHGGSVTLDDGWPYASRRRNDAGVAWQALSLG